MLVKRTTLALVFLVIFSILANAQDTPGDLRGLVGVRASNGESELRARGFSFVKTTTNGNRKWSNWWNYSRGLCISVVTYDGRYDSIVTAPGSDCGQGYGGGNDTNQVTVYEDRDFRGRSQTFSEGRYLSNRNELGNLRNDRASSVEVPIGSSVRLCDSEGVSGMGGGTCLIYGPGRQNLPSNLNDRVSYVEVTQRGSGGWGNNNGQQVSPPTWARGTFYGTAPDGTQISLTISNNGAVSANIGGTIRSGSYTRGDMLNMGDSISRVARAGDGFTTTRVDNGERIVYSKNNWSGGWGNNNGQQVSPPTWARGTFYGTAPNGTQITLTILNNGVVTANIGGTLQSGSYTRGDMLNMGDSVSRVARAGNGFTTTRTDNGERIVYSKNVWNGGGTGTGNGNQVSPPSWARGTFFGTAPNGTQITLTISNNGAVTANIGGTLHPGSYTKGDMLNMGDSISQVARSGDGFTTTRIDNGERIYYTRSR
ncbi:hypothetical protein BH10ACI3_BH10ACI3_11100 [soil metagenome]